MGALMAVAGHSNPCGHAVQVAAVPGLNEPGEQGDCAVEPGAGAKYPGSTELQESSPLLGWNVPGGQGWQATPALYVPAGQVDCGKAVTVEMRREVVKTERAMRMNILCVWDMQLRLDVLLSTTDSRCSYLSGFGGAYQIQCINRPLCHKCGYVGNGKCSSRPSETRGSKSSYGLDKVPNRRTDMSVTLEQRHLVQADKWYP